MLADILLVGLDSLFEASGNQFPNVADFFFKILDRNSRLGGLCSAFFSQCSCLFVDPDRAGRGLAPFVNSFPKELDCAFAHRLRPGSVLSFGPGS